MTHLSLGVQRITPKGLRAFAAAARLPRLEMLDVSYITGAATVATELRGAFPALSDLRTTCVVAPS